MATEQRCRFRDWDGWPCVFVEADSIHHIVTQPGHHTFRPASAPSVPQDAAEQARSTQPSPDPVAEAWDGVVRDGELYQQGYEQGKVWARENELPAALAAERERIAGELEKFSDAAMHGQHPFILRDLDTLAATLRAAPPAAPAEAVVPVSRLTELVAKWRSEVPDPVSGSPQLLVEAAFQAGVGTGYMHCADELAAALGAAATEEGER